MNEKKDVNFFSAQLKLWTRIFDYKGTSTRKEYWFAFILHAIIGIFAFINVGSSFVVLFLANFNDDLIILANILHYILLIGGFLMLAYLTISLIPWIALTVRRLRDAGKSEWWILLFLIFGVGHIILLCFCALGSSVTGLFYAPGNFLGEVYGPPEWYDDYNPGENDPVGVYGPPSWVDEQDPVEYNGIGTPEEKDYNPDDNINEDVYGPPDWLDEEDDFNPETNIEGQIYGPPDWLDEEDDFNPETNIEGQIYGPPDWY